MSYMIICTPVLSDAATVTASNSATGAPAGNLQRMQPSDIWQSTTLTPYITVDLGSVVDFDFVGLLFTNATTACTWRLRTADTEANLTASPTYDSGAVTFCPWTTVADRRHGFTRSTVGWSNRWLRIDLSDAGNGDGYLYAGRLYVAAAYCPELNYDIGASFGFLDTSSRERTLRGNTVPNRQGIIPVLEFSLKCTDRTEMYTKTHAIQMLRAASRDVLIILDPDSAIYAHDTLYYGLLSATLRITNSDFGGVYTQRYEIEGLI